jgi:hypothetical protein
MGARNPEVPTDARLDELRRVGDPLADETIAAILGECPVLAAGPPVASAALACRDAPVRERIERVGILNEAIRDWRDNTGLAGWRAGARPAALGMAGPLERFVREASKPPAWADPHRIERAQRMFEEQGLLSVTALFCASLPECYVLPDLAAVLHATGELEDRADYRIRRTGAMVFPVMMSGGLALQGANGAPGGSGVAQMLKVRLIHGMIRNLLLRGGPPAPDALRAGLARAIPRLARPARGDSMAAALHVHGWDLARRGIPNNQEQLAYTLLTFSYVFLRAARRLDIRFAKDECEDYIHAWNVAGHYLGIANELMVRDMDAAGELFDRMQARGRAPAKASAAGDDPRPMLAGALMRAMQTVLPEGPAKGFPVLLTRRMIGRRASRELGLQHHVGWIARLAFAALMAAARAVDWVGRIGSRDFSVGRLVTRIVGRPILWNLLMKETRTLAVPKALHARIEAVVRGWGRDTTAPRVMQAIESRLVRRGDRYPPDDTALQ